MTTERDAIRLERSWKARIGDWLQREDMQALGPIRLKDVEDSQQAMVQSAKDLADLSEQFEASRARRGEDQFDPDEHEHGVTARQHAVDARTGEHGGECEGQEEVDHFEPPSLRVPIIARAPTSATAHREVLAVARRPMRTSCRMTRGGPPDHRWAPLRQRSCRRLRSGRSSPGWSRWRACSRSCRCGPSR